MPVRRDRHILALLLAVLLVAGCGGDPKSAGPPEGSSSSTAGRTPGSTPGPSPGSSPGDGAEPAPDPGFEAPDVGQCTRMTSRQSSASVARGRSVDCRKQHTSVVVHVGYLRRPLTSLSSLAQLRRVGDRICAPAYRRLAGGTQADRATSILTWTLFTPGQAQLERGARWVRCDVLARSGDQLVPLPAGRPLLAQGVPEQLRICQTPDGRDVSCSQPHAFRVSAVYRGIGTAYPDATEYAAVARTRCRELTGASGGYWQPPGPSGWKAGDRFIRCLSAQTS